MALGSHVWIDLQTNYFVIQIETELEECIKDQMAGITERSSKQLKLVNLCLGMSLEDMPVSTQGAPSLNETHFGSLPNP